MATKTQRKYCIAVFGYWYEPSSKTWKMRTDEMATSAMHFRSIKKWRNEFDRLECYLPEGTRVLAQVIEVPVRRLKGIKDANGFLPKLRISNEEFKLFGAPQ